MSVLKCSKFISNKSWEFSCIFTSCWSSILARCFRRFQKADNEIKNQNLYDYFFLNIWLLLRNRILAIIRQTLRIPTKFYLWVLLRVKAMNPNWTFRTTALGFFRPLPNIQKSDYKTFSCTNEPSLRPPVVARRGLDKCGLPRFTTKTGGPEEAKARAKTVVWLLRLNLTAEVTTDALLARGPSAVPAC